MIYRFAIVSDEADNFKLQIAIDSTATFMQLRNIILDSAGYSKEQMDSFYICDDEWTKEKEVTCMDMGSDSDEDIWIMDDTQLDELLDEEGQRMKFVFDYMTERFFKVKLKEVIPGKTLHDPLCESKIGNPPVENMDITDSLVKHSPEIICRASITGAAFVGKKSRFILLHQQNRLLLPQ